nr:MAG TPA: hypothetical protein [Caudoviricetes sp.]DAY96069.1 MAG TPA: hypothetical protein [Caudoviricetes sp.]
MRERLKIRLPLRGWMLRERLLFQSSPCCGEDTYILRIYIRVPPHGVTGVGEGRALGLPGPVSLPPPR